MGVFETAGFLLGSGIVFSSCSGGVCGFKDLEDPPEAAGNCFQVALVVCEFVAGAQMVRVSYLDASGVPLVHYASVVDGMVLDFTARQFDSGPPFPFVVSVGEWFCWLSPILVSLGATRVLVPVVECLFLDTQFSVSSAALSAGVSASTVRSIF